MAAARKRSELIAQQERLREAYNELKYTAPDKVEAMRDQEMMRLKMSLAYRTGNIFMVNAPFLRSHDACTACSFREGLKLCSFPDLSICSLET